MERRRISPKLLFSAKEWNINRRCPKDQTSRLNLCRKEATLKSQHRNRIRRTRESSRDEKRRENPVSSRLNNKDRTNKENKANR